MTTGQDEPRQAASAVDSSGTQHVEAEAAGAFGALSTPGSMLDIEEAPGRVAKLVALVRQFGSIISNAVRDMWREALDLKHPPPWIKALVTVCLMSVIIALIPLGKDLFTALGVRTGSSLSGAKLSRVVLDAVRSYLTHHAAGLPLSPDELWTAWKVSGVILFASALIGFTGGRIGWALFGVLTAPMIWIETARPAAWIATGIGVTWWSVLSIIAYGRRSNKNRPTRKPPTTDSDKWAREEEIERKAEKEAIRTYGCKLPEYFEARGNQPVKTIAKELKIRKDQDASSLRRKYLPEWVSLRSSLVPGTQIKIIHDYLIENAIPVEPGQRYGATTNQVQNLINRYKEVQRKTSQAP